MEEKEAYEKARKRVEELKGFYWHLAIYLIVNTLLLIHDYNTGGNYWFYWPLLGWGFGLASHGFSVSKFKIPMVEKWENKKVEELKDEYSD